MDEVFPQGSLVSTQVPLQGREQGAEHQDLGFLRLAQVGGPSSAE